MSKLCQDCQKPIPSFIVANGIHKKVNHYRRSCFECRPFGCFDNREPEIRKQQEGVREGYKICSTCRHEKVLEEFCWNGTRKGRQANCKECAANLKKIWRLEIKRKCVNYKGGQCFFCGYKKAFTSLCFHHRDPKTKKFAIGMPFRREWEEMKRELDKCILLCANCHGEIHEGIKKLPKEVVSRERDAD